MQLPPPAEEFLKRVRQGLATLSQTERDEIINELRAHMLDRQAQGNSDVLAGFEPAEVLASNFVTEYALRGALARGTSWALGRALLIAARDSVLGLFVVLPLVLVQICAFLFLVTALLKPFMPYEMGLWVGGGNFYVGVNNGNPAIREVLGWWGVPVLAVSGVILFWISNRAMRALVRWRLRSSTKAS